MKKKNKQIVPCVGDLIFCPLFSHPYNEIMRITGIEMNGGVATLVKAKGLTTGCEDTILITQYHEAQELLGSKVKKLPLTHYFKVTDEEEWELVLKTLWKKQAAKTLKAGISEVLTRYNSMFGMTLTADVLIELISGLINTPYNKSLSL